MNFYAILSSIVIVLGFGAACFYCGKRFAIWSTTDYVLRHELIQRRLKEKLHYEALKEVDNDELREDKPQKGT